LPRRTSSTTTTRRILEPTYSDEVDVNSIVVRWRPSLAPISRTIEGARATEHDSPRPFSTPCLEFTAELRIPCLTQGRAGLKNLPVCALSLGDRSPDWKTAPEVSRFVAFRSLPVTRFPGPHRIPAGKRQCEAGGHEQAGDGHAGGVSGPGSSGRRGGDGGGSRAPAPQHDGVGPPLRVEGDRAGLGEVPDGLPVGIERPRAVGGGAPACLCSIGAVQEGAAVGILDRFSLCCQSEFATVLHRTHIAQIALHS